MSVFDKDGSLPKYVDDLFRQYSKYSLSIYDEPDIKSTKELLEEKEKKKKINDLERKLKIVLTENCVLKNKKED